MRLGVGFPCSFPRGLPQAHLGSEGWMGGVVIDIGSDRLPEHLDFGEVPFAQASLPAVIETGGIGHSVEQAVIVWSHQLKAHAVGRQPIERSDSHFLAGHGRSTYGAVSLHT